MNKQDFIDRLRMALNGRVSPGLVMDNVNYYEDYINTEIRKGRTEEEVLESLGDPREAAGSTVHHSYNGDGNGEYGTHRSKMADVLAKLPVWVWIILGILVVVLVISAVFSVLSFLAPVLIPILVVLFLVKLFRDWLN